MDDATQVRSLIERWAKAVHAGDLDGVLADHAADIVMFDVPSPEDGVRGIEVKQHGRWVVTHEHHSFTSQA